MNDERRKPHRGRGPRQRGRMKPTSRGGGADSDMNWRRRPHEETVVNSDLCDVATPLSLETASEPLGRLLFKLREHPDGQNSGVKAVRMTWNSTVIHGMDDVISMYVGTDNSSNRSRSVALPSNVQSLWTQLIGEMANISPINDHVFGRSLEVIYGVQERYRISSLSGKSLLTEMEVLLGAFDVCQPWIRVPLLRALAALILGNIVWVRPYVSWLVDRFEAEACWDMDKGCPMMVIYAISGLTNLSYVESPANLYESLSADSCPSGYTTRPKVGSSTGETSEDILMDKKNNFVPRLLKTFIKSLESEPSVDLELSAKYRLQQLCLHGVNLLLQRSPKLDLPTVGRLLTLVRTLIGSGLVRYPANQGPIITLGSGTNTDAPLLATGRSLRATPKRRDKRYRPIETSRGPLEERLADLKLDNSHMSDLLVSETSTDSAFHGYFEDFSFSEEGGSDSDAATPSSALENLDVMDTDDTDLKRERRWQAKTRRLSILALKMLLELSQKRVLLASWPSFLPDGSGTQTPNLLTLLMKEADPKMRHLILETISVFLESGRQYLSAAEDLVAPNTAFTPYSVRLATAVRDLHRRLLLALLAERSGTVQVLLLKCLSTLVSCCPYHKLKPGLLTRVVRVVIGLLDREQADLRTGALTVLAAIVALEGPLLEVCHLLSNQPEPTTAEEKVSSNSGGPPSADWSGVQTPFMPEFQLDGDHFHGCWLVQMCLRLAHPAVSTWRWEVPAAGAAAYQEEELEEDKQSGMVGKRESPNVRIQAVSTLRQMIPTYIRYLRPSFNPLKRVLQLLLQEADNDHIMLRTQALKLLCTLIPAILGSTEEDRAIIEDLWREFIDPLIACIQSESHFSVRSWSCQCLALLDEHIFSKAFSPRQGLILRSTLLQLCSDEDRQVRGNAVRTLGYWVTLSPLNVESSFISDVIYECERLCYDADVTVVRCHAAWCLANCTEVMVAYKEGLLPSNCEDVDGFMMEFAAREERLVRLFDTCRFLCSGVSGGPGSLPAGGPGVAKHCENGARALGHLFRFVPAEVKASSGMRNTFEEAAKCLGEAMIVHEVNGAAKIRWNACFAAGNFFRNPALPVGSDWTIPVVEHLCMALLKDKYFKVRSYACISLLVLCESRCRLGPASLLCRLLEAACCAGSAVANTEVAYTEQHHRAYCLFLITLLLISACARLTTEDLTEVATVFNLEEARLFMQRCSEVWQHAEALKHSQVKDPMILRSVLVHNTQVVSDTEVLRSLDLLEGNLAQLRAQTTNSDHLVLLDQLEVFHSLVFAGRAVTMETDEAQGAEACMDPGQLSTGGPLAFRQTYD